MAPNKFASMLHRNTNRLTLVLVYVLLEWILIAMILLNSLFSYLIVKYTDYFGLKRPCVLCSRIDHGKDKRVRKDMICEEHALEISELGFCRSHQKLVKCSQMCLNCSDSSFYRIEKDLRCSCCDEGLEVNPVSQVLIDDRDFHFFDLAGVDEDHEKQIEEDIPQLVSVERVMSGDHDDEEDVEDVCESFVAENDQDFAHAPDTESRRVYPESSDSLLTADTYEEAQARINNADDNVLEDSSECSDIIVEIENLEEARQLSANGVKEETVFESKLELEHQEVTLRSLAESSDQYTSTVEKLQTALNEARVELQKARNDAAEASYQTMEMITKLREENAALQLEASQYQRLSDRQISLDQDTVLPQNESNSEQQQSDTDAASTIEKLTMALNDAYAELEQERNDYAEASSQTMSMISKLQEAKATLELEASQYQRLTEEQIAFDEEAVLLLDEMVRRREKENHELEKQLEFYKRRFAEQENTSRSVDDHLHQNHKNMALATESVSVCCSSFGDQDSDGVSTEDYDLNQQNVDHHDEHPFLDSEEDERLLILERLNELEQKLVQEDNDNIVEEDDMKCRTDEQEEDDEEDKEFLRRCIKTVKKGDEGMSLVQEILQHLRALRRMEISFS